jgi:hypothetical protein
MSVTVLPVSHVDHGLSKEQLAWLLGQFADKEGFFLTTVELPEALGTVPCGIHGPIMGDEPVSDNEVRNEVRGDREWTSRVCDRPARQVRSVSIIAGPHGEEACVLYTAFGGPISNQEPGDPGVQGDEAKLAASVEFWGQHALSA